MLVAMNGRVRALRSAIPCAPIVLAIAGCGVALPGSGDRLHEQAQAALARWADAAGQAKEQSLVFVGELTGQIGDWEPSVGDNNKPALMAGDVRPAASLSTETLPPGEVRWSDGTSKTVELLSAAQALDEIAKSADAPCPECRPLKITAARLTTGSAQTSRGPALAPIWEFTVEGTNVKITRIAVANRISVVPPPWDPNNRPEGIDIRSARGSADMSRLTVSFIGSPGHREQPCGADYAAEAVESNLAVVVIVTEHRNPSIGACTAIGADRTAVVDLAAPLGDRAVLDVQRGLPVPLLVP
jgi:hypothetical protein